MKHSPMSEISQRLYYRDPYWDCLKAVLIFLVILGHVIKHHVSKDYVGIGIYNFIYIFHMPLFIFVSGRFSQKKTNKAYLWNIIKLFETYFVFQLILTLLTDCIISHHGFDFYEFIFTPQWAMWYLLALACWRLLILAIPETLLKDYPKPLIILSFVIGLASGFIPLDEYFISHHILSSLPFFMLGYYSYKINIPVKISHIPSWIAWSVLLIVLIMCCSWLNEKKYYYILTGGYSYYFKPIFSVFGHFIARVIIYVSAILLSIMIMRIIPISKKIAQWGTMTLIAYVYHPPLIIIVNKTMMISSFHPTLPFLFILAVTITLFLFYISRFKLVRILTNPFTYWKNKKGREKDK